MQVTYLFHSGFLVEATECYYIFDYWKGALPALDADKPVFVFVSHRHPDHYNPEVFALLRGMGMKRITAVLAKDIPERQYPEDRAQITFVKAYHSKEYLLPCSTRVQTLLSTDSGVAYYVACPDGAIYHAGDLNEWNTPETPEQERRQMAGRYRASVGRLKEKSIDIAFLPLDPRLKECYADGFVYFLKNMKVKTVYPMHYWDQPEIIGRFLEEYPQYAQAVCRPQAQRCPAAGTLYSYCTSPRTYSPPLSNGTL